jgi:hypothetical protein
VAAVASGSTTSIGGFGARGSDVRSSAAPALGGVSLGGGMSASEVMALTNGGGGATGGSRPFRQQPGRRGGGSPPIPPENTSALGGPGSICSGIPGQTSKYDF